MPFSIHFFDNCPLLRFPFSEGKCIIESQTKTIQMEEHMSEVILNSSNFEKEVINSDIPVLVDFWATWCGPCKMIAPIVAQLAVKYEGKVKVGKVDVDECPEIAESFNISSIPTLIMFKNGEVAGQRVGGANMAVLEAFINENA